ncbi:dynactin p62 [Gigaspora margarita]|uniref:Dynactin subunit 4 n=1 Tax=Gigaspora margarita TaxID=4874 RepID=A0A8H3WY71_GIGMA|nr:dynactin p62 [Gigaspora margarita]
MSQQIDARQRSYVHYYCPCPDVSKSNNNTGEDEEEDIVESIPDFDVNSPRIHFSTFPISKLYFCDDCHQIRCPRCVQEEIVCYYCPNCLFEVPTASVKSERNRCARNCFQCPICQNTLTVVASTEPPPPQPSASSNSSTSTTSGAPYYLSCGVCRWDSQEIGMTFEKATGLALQLQKTEDERPDVKEFDHLKDHFEKHLRLSAPSTTLPSSLLSIPGISSFSNRYGGGGFTHPQQKSDDVAKYNNTIKIENDDNLVHDLVQLKDVNQITTLTQRMNQLSDQPYKVERLQPQRIHLRTKRVKRCRSCRHILIKPEQKAQATRFKIKLVALNHIPKLTITSLPKLFLNQSTEIILKFSNPLYEEIIVDLALKKDETTETTEYAKIKLLAPHFNITPYNEVWEYDEQDFNISSKGRPSSTASAPKPDIGIYERRGNYTSVKIEITPLAEVDELKFPLLVTYANKVNDNNDNETSGDAPANDSSTAAETVSSDKPNTDADKPNTDADKPDTDVNKPKTDDTDKGESTPTTKSLFFWTVIGLGPVVNPATVKPPAPTRSPLTNNNSNVAPTRTNINSGKA